MYQSTIKGNKMRLLITTLTFATTEVVQNKRVNVSVPLVNLRSSLHV